MFEDTSLDALHQGFRLIVLPLISVMHLTVVICYMQV